MWLVLLSPIRPLKRHIEYDFDKMKRYSRSTMASKTEYFFSKQCKSKVSQRRFYVLSDSHGILCISS